MDRIGRYKILSELGRGAMGVVYRAEDPKIGREVAIKTLKLADKADSSEIDGLRERLMREAQSAGRLSHPGIVTIYDVDEEDGIAYIAMEFVEGRTFDSYLHDGLLRDLHFGADVIGQAAAALDYAHSKEIVHRDIKPANLMMTAHDVVKIMDFGIARVSSSQLTQTGTVMGTPSYMSPEQVRGEGLDGRSDQFSLGVIAYQLLTGKKPFVGDNLTAVIFKIVSSDPPKPSELCPWLTPEVDAAIGRALSKDAGERFESCREFAASFKAAVDGLTVPEDAEVATAPGLDPSVTQDIERLTAEANEDTVISTAADEPTAKLPPIARPTEGPEEEAPAGGRKLVWFAGFAAAAVMTFAGAVEATAGGLFVDPMGAAQQAWAVWFGVPPAVEEVVEAPPPPVNEVAPVILPDPELVEEVADEQPAEVRGDPPPTQEVELAEQAEAPAETPAPPVEEAPAPTPPPAQAVAAPAPRRTSTRTTSVYFRTTPAGATVVVDNRAEWTCRTPCTIEDLPAGRRTVTATRAGFQTTRRTFVAGTQAEMIVELGLPDNRVQLLITSRPSGADIYIDGRMISQKTDAKVPLPEGTYRVRVVKEGSGEAEQVVQVNRQGLPFAQFVLEESAP